MLNAKLNVHGPVHIYVGHKAVGPAGGLYLGTCEDSPVISFKYEWEDVTNDIGGKAPVDVVFRGFTAEISGVLTRFNEGHILNYANSTGFKDFVASSAQIPGLVPHTAIGGLSEYSNSIVKNSGFWMALKNEYFGLDGYIYPGHWFPSTIPAVFKYEQVGTGVKKLAFQTQAHPAIQQNPSDGNAGTQLIQGMSTDGSYLLRLFSVSSEIFNFAQLPVIN